jgi:PAS domain S-box-containing protein
MGVLNIASASERADHLGRTAGLFVSFAGALVLMGWALDMDGLKSLFWHGPKMARITGLGFALLGIGLWSAATDKIQTSRQSTYSALRLLQWGCAGAVVLISITRLVGILTGWHLGVSDGVFSEPAGTRNPASMGPPIAFSFLLLGVALVLAKNSRLLGAFQALTLIAGLIGWLGLNQQLFGGEPLLPYLQMIIPTALLLFVVSAGVLCLQTEGGLGALLISQGPSGLISRRLVPTVIFAPVVLRWFRMQGQLAGWYGSQAGWSLFTLSIVLLFAGLTWTAAALLHRTEIKAREREADQQFLLALGTELQTTMDPQKIAQIATRRVGAYLNPARCGWVTVDQRLGEFTVQHEHRQANRPSLEGTYKLEIWGDSKFLSTLAAGQTLVVDDTASDQRTAPRYISTYRPRGTEAMVIVPLVRGGEWVGALGLADAHARAWSEREVLLARSAAERIWPAYEAATAWVAERQIHEQLIATEARFQRLIDADVVGIVIADAERILEANDYFLQMLGYSREELQGGNIRWENITMPESLERERSALDHLVETGTQSATEREYLHKGGTRVSVLAGSVVISPVPTAQFLSFIVDQTERKRLEEQFRQAQKMDSIGQLAGGIAHDFNNLLTVISGYTEMMLNEIDEQHPFFESIQEIFQAAMRAASLTQQLLTFSRRQVTQPKNIRLNDVVRDVQKMLERLITENIEIVFSLSAESGIVQADPGQLSQVLINLAVNARDAMPEGGQLIIETSNVFIDDQFAHMHLSVNEGLHVMLVVSDTGIGMSPEVQAHIFEPFFTTKEQGKGTGLGLSTVFGIVKEAGGSIWVYSEPGNGTTFKILFPAVEAAGEESRPAVVPIRSSQNETILVAEDEKGLRKFLRRTLEQQGYTVLEASNGKEALEITQRHSGKIDLLLTDLVMPQMGGTELAAAFSLARPGVPILRMSGYTDRLGKRVETEAYIQKPFTPNALLARIQEALEGTESESAPFQ